ncbi:quaternary ammonium compound-resistance protein SugE [Ereboglobus sp. PH5-5]|uniref:quaternary ammonium compound efflux SMR transporter SugE n=1 Tax=unclassified Ereboglobus TaxID=2626932 RepID=UPI00240726D2|nr:MULTISPECIES: quaternary ammonium compound efflux SMR transporter SugE [unclassified Ereboglobus]MDF9827236.1 quaternary ammonium compound-resistance protein SugE [Ereboglobus sp. PH5-10]MDF9833714.1 quaternary ammonium compound-resistance protein SugE [Ereboglobus sp. PH5-5]
MAWVYLVIAGVFEVVWAIGMKQSDGFSRFWPGVVTIVFMLASFALLAMAMKQLPVGTAYAIWTGIGAAGAAIVGMMFLGESRDVPRILCVCLIVGGVVGLKLLAKPAA